VYGITDYPFFWPGALILFAITVGVKSESGKTPLLDK
jgi:hypothetical protein